MAQPLDDVFSRDTDGQLIFLLIIVLKSLQNFLCSVRFVFIGRIQRNMPCPIKLHVSDHACQI